MSSLSTITITKTERATAHNGTEYIRVFDDNDNMFSCFEIRYAELLEKNTGKSVDVESLGLVIKEIVKGGKHYLNLIPAGAPKIPVRSSKEDTIKNAIERREVSENSKAERIEKAMDRNELMYAKLGACQLVAMHKAYKNYSAEDVEKSIAYLTKFILEVQPSGDELPE